MCLSVCTPATTGASSFFLSGNGTKTISGFNNSSSAPRGCHQDFLHFSSGTHDKNSADRFCGAAFSPADNGNNTKVCCKSEIFFLSRTQVFILINIHCSSNQAVSYHLYHRRKRIWRFQQPRVLLRLQPIIKFFVPFNLQYFFFKMYYFITFMVTYLSTVVFRVF